MNENARFFAKNDMGELACYLCDTVLEKKDIEKLKKKLEEM